MARKRRIPATPTGHKNYFVVDSNVLAYVALSAQAVDTINDAEEARRAQCCSKWWKRIREQLQRGQARVYVPDVCIAEAFKVLAKWFYQKGFFPSRDSFYRARRRLHDFVTTSHSQMQRATRRVEVHDVATNRDIVIGSGRFFKTVFGDKKTRSVSIVDLIVLAVAKYLMEFYDLPREHLYVLTSDRALVRLCTKVQELPAAIDPTDARYDADQTFV